jgi:hypothetical protein
MSYTPPIGAVAATWVGATDYKPPLGRFVATWSDDVSQRWVLPLGVVPKSVLGVPAAKLGQFFVNPVGLAPGHVGTANILDNEDREYAPPQWVLDARWTVDDALRFTNGAALSVTWDDSIVRISVPSIDPPEVPAPHLYGTQLIQPLGEDFAVMGGNTYVLHPYEYAPPQWVLDASWVGKSTYTPPTHVVDAAWQLPSEDTVLALTGWESSAVGLPTLYGLTQYVLPQGIASQAFGIPVLINGAYGINLSGRGIAPTSAVGLPFISHRIRYITPTGMMLFVSDRPVVQNWVRYLQPMGMSVGSYGTAVLTRGVRSLSPGGFDASRYGTARIENKTRYYNLIGWVSSTVPDGHRVWDGKQHVVNVSLGASSVVANPIVSEPSGPPDDTQYVELSGQGIGTPDNQVWPLHKIENRTKQAFPEGFTSYGLGSPRVDQTIYLTIRPLGADWSEFGTPFVDQTIKKLFPEGFTSEFVPASHQIWNFKIDVVAGGWNSYVSGDHTVTRGTARPIVPGIPPKSVVATGARVEFRIRPFTPHGWVATLWGNAVVQNRDVVVEPGGIPPLPQTGPPSQWRIPAPTIWYRTRYIGPDNAGAIKPGDVPTSHKLTHYLQYVDLAARGIAPGPVGTAFISNRYRTIFPTFVASMIFGTPTVKRRIFVEPVGWDSAEISENAEVLINTRRVYVLTGEADPAQYGVATVFNWVQNIDLDRNGWYDTQWNFPVVYNLKQEVQVGPFMDNLNPDQWGRYYPFIENKDRELRTSGHVSSRVSVAADVVNKAVPVHPQGLDATLWGEGTFIAHRVRNVSPSGWDSFYNERYTVVWNAAFPILPPSIGDTSGYGRPTVENLNREVKQHSGWSGPEWGVPFVAFRVRTIAPGLFYDVPASFPEVRHNPAPIAPVGIPWQGQVGGHEVRIFRREVFPYAVNVHDPWFGEPSVRNRNVEVAPYGYDQSEFGRAVVENFIRYVEPEGFTSEDVPKHLIGRRTRELNPLGISFPPFVQLHRIRNLLPDPPGPQKIDLSRTGEDGEVEDGHGIPPPLNLQRPVVRFNTIFPEWPSPSSRFGVGRVWSNAIEPKFWMSDGAVGTPTLIFTQYLYPKPVEPLERPFGTPRMTPHHIYAPSGSERPPGYTPNNGGMAIDARLTSFDGSNRPWFGRATVTNQHRTIGPVPYRSGAIQDDLNGRTKWGNASFTLRTQYVYIDSIRSLRMGFPVLWGVTQYINLDDPGYQQGIPPYNVFGSTHVGFPIDPHAPQYIRPNGFVATLWGANRIELLNRAIFPQGIPHRGNPQQNMTTPWGTAMVGYPRRYTVGMGSQTLWGNTVIEYLNRQVWPEGWNSCSLESWDFENYKFPMKVTRRNPLTRPEGFGGESFGSCTVSQFVRTVYSRGIDGYNSGSHSVKSSSTISVHGWESLLFGDIDRWEAGKIKAHGDDMSTVGTPRLLHPVRPTGIDESIVPAPRVSPVVSPVGIPGIAFDGPSVTNPFGCTNRVVSPLPILSTQTVPSPVVA